LDHCRAAASVASSAASGTRPKATARRWAAQLTNIRTGHAYINFHSVQFGGGEIRGNIPSETAFRDSLVRELNAATENTCAVLRKVAENEELALE